MSDPVANSAGSASVPISICQSSPPIHQTMIDNLTFVATKATATTTTTMKKVDADATLDGLDDQGKIIFNELDLNLNFFGIF